LYVKVSPQLVNLPGFALPAKVITKDQEPVTELPTN